MENYICIDGIKFELADCQLEHIETILESRNKTPFGGSDKYGRSFCILNDGQLSEWVSPYSEMLDDEEDRDLYILNDRTFADTLRLTELLNRKLLEYSYKNGWTRKDDTDTNGMYYSIYLSVNNYYSNYIGWAVAEARSTRALNTVYFKTYEIAEKAIEEIVKPFIQKHENFAYLRRYQ